MKLTRIQKIGLVFFVCTLLPAYWIANWRYEANLANLTETLNKEQALHLSTDKLLRNCEKNAEGKAHPYDATHQICNQGSDIHARTDHAMDLLTQEKANNETKWYRNFAFSILFFNLLAAALYRLNTYLNRDVG